MTVKVVVNDLAQDRTVNTQLDQFAECEKNVEGSADDTHSNFARQCSWIAISVQNSLLQPSV